MTKAYCTKLPNRAEIRVSGADARGFLQGLITQDVELLAGDTVLYSALLTPQGKFEFDFYMRLDGNDITLDCDATRADALVKKLSMYKLRKDVTLTIASLDVWAVWGDSMARAYAVPDAEAVDFNTYDLARITMGIPDGVRDFVVGEDTVADMGLEKLGGVSYTKGCYMGQELTSRMHHRGLSKRGLYVVRGKFPEPYKDITANGHLIGSMRSSIGNIGLMMLRHDSVQLAKHVGLTPIT